MFNFLRNLFGLKSSALSGLPAYAVTVTDREVINRRPDGFIERIQFSDLNSIVIETNDRGPMEPDVWWQLIGESGARCVFPLGAAGEDAVLDRVLKLPEFDHMTFAEAMTSTQIRQFQCWQRN
jgi:hypothetical protein